MKQVRIRLLVGAAAIAACPQIVQGQTVAGTPPTAPAPDPRAATGAPLAVSASTQANDGAAPAEAAAATEPPPEGNDIVVTAQRRSARLQDVPVAVTAISSAALARSGFTNAQDIQYLTPTLQVNRAGSEVFQVRGVGTPITGYYLEQSVGVVVDGVPIALPSDVGLGPLADVAQVEVLRGPQGTLFGKNASAGLVNITTRLPEFDGFAADGRVSYGSRDDIRTAITMNIPLGETLAALVTGAAQHQDGFIRNVRNGRTLGSYTDKAVRAKLRWQPSSVFEARLNGDYQTRSGSDPAYVYTFRSFTPGTAPATGYGSAAFGIVAGPDNTTVAQDSDTFFDATRQGAALTMIYRMGGFTVTSISAYRHVKTAYQIDNDAGPAEVSLSPNWSSARQFSQELRVEIPHTSFLDAQAGAFYYNRAGTQFFQTHGTFARTIPAGFNYYSYSGGLQRDHAENENHAGFADATFHLLPGLNVEIGGRYTHDSVAAQYSVTPIAGYVPVGARIPANGYTDRFDNDDFSYRGSVQYKITPDVMAYVSYARGYKGPGFAGTNAALVRIKPETVKSVEAGLKASFLDRKASLNVAVFHSKFTNFQTQAQNPVTKIVSLTNAGGQRTQGAEMELSLRPIDRLTFSASVAYTDAEFTDYQNSCYVGQTAEAGCINGSFQAAGVSLPLVAKISNTAAVNYVQPIDGDYQFDLNANLFSKGPSLSSVDPATRIPGYAIVNANIGFGPQDGAWRASVFARNLFDSYYVAKISRIFDGYLNTPAAEARRTIGVQLGFSFR